MMELIFSEIQWGIQYFWWSRISKSMMKTLEFHEFSTWDLEYDPMLNLVRAKLREFSGMIPVITRNVIIPATPSNPIQQPYVKRTSKHDGLTNLAQAFEPKRTTNPPKILWMGQRNPNHQLIDGKHPIIYRVSNHPRSTIQGGSGFPQPSKSDC